MMKVLPLSSPKVMLSLGYKRYYGQLRLPCRPSETSFPYIHRLPLSRHRQGSPAFIIVWLPLRVTPVTPGVHLSVLVVFVRIDAPVFPFVGEGRQLHRTFRGYIWIRSRCDPQVRSTPLRSLCQETQCFRLPFTPPSSYMGELPNSHGWTLTNKSYVLHGIPYEALETSVIDAHCFPFETWNLLLSIYNSIAYFGQT